MVYHTILDVNPCSRAWKRPGNRRLRIGRYIEAATRSLIPLHRTPSKRVAPMSARCSIVRKISARYRTSRELQIEFSDEKSFDLTPSTRRVAYEFRVQSVGLVNCATPDPLFVDLAFLASLSAGYSRTTVNTPEDRIRLFLAANTTPALPSSRSSHDLTQAWCASLTRRWTV